MKSEYFILTRENDIRFLGEFSSFYDAWDYADYDSDVNFVWIIKKENLQNLKEKINQLTKS